MVHGANLNKYSVGDYHGAAKYMTVVMSMVTAAAGSLIAEGKTVMLCST